MKRKIFIPVLASTILFIGTSFKNDYFEIAKQVEIFTTLFKELNMNYVDETNPAELMDTAIKGMLNELDPYTQFMNEQDVQNFRINAAGEYSGIGALVRSMDDKLVVVEPYQGYPADKAGLKAGDEIVKIGDIAVSDFREDASDLLKGASDSEVLITFNRQGKTQTTTLKRESIEIDAVPFYKKLDDGTGYIALTRFNSKASSQTKEALKELKDQGITRLVLDLRGNPGGLLSEAIEVCNLFVPEGELIVSTRSKVKKFNQEYKTRRKPVDTGIPLAVLIDEGSASASEIVSGALQDLDRAVIVGGQSFGKGLVQRPLKLAYGTQLKVTISRYYTPSGRCLQALDYWNRDEAGNAVKIASERQFTTRNGRPVTEGGGVVPDVVIDSYENTPLIQSMERQHLIFDFATTYTYENPGLTPETFEADAGLLSEFTSYLNSRDWKKLETPSEAALKDWYAKVDPQRKDAGVGNQFESLLKALQQQKENVLITNKDIISRKLADEIVLRYGYRKGLYSYQLQHDPAILEAATVLANDNKLQALLK